VTQITVAVWHAPMCPGCLGTGNCWVCLGTGSLAVLDAKPTRCARCHGSGRCAEVRRQPVGALDLPA